MNKAIGMIVSSALVVAGAIAATPSMAAGRGDAACFVTPNAPIYRGSKGDEVIVTKDVGDCVSGATMVGLLGMEPLFEEADGRLQVFFFPDKDEKGSYKSGWVIPEDISKFTFECGCGSNKEEREKCTPFSMIGFLSGFAYNACFKEAAGKKKSEILKKDASASKTSSPNTKTGRKAGTDGKAIKNDDIVSLVKVGLDDKLIISKINTARATEFDLSTEGLVALKTAKVSNAVISAMMKVGGKND